MGILSSIFGKKENKPKSNLNTEEYLSFLDAEKFIDNLLKEDAYISKKQYLDKIASYKKTIDYYSVLESSGMLESYCLNHGVSYENMIKTLDILKNIESCVDEHNDKYIEDKKVKEKSYLDNILKKVDPVSLS